MARIRRLASSLRRRSNLYRLSVRILSGRHFRGVQTRSAFDSLKSQFELWVKRSLHTAESGGDTKVRFFLHANQHQCAELHIRISFRSETLPHIFSGGFFAPSTCDCHTRPASLRWQPLQMDYPGYFPAPIRSRIFLSVSRGFVKVLRPVFSGNENEGLESRESPL